MLRPDSGSAIGLLLFFFYWRCSGRANDVTFHFVTDGSLLRSSPESSSIIGVYLIENRRLSGVSSAFYRLLSSDPSYFDGVFSRCDWRLDGVLSLTSSSNSTSSSASYFDGVLSVSSASSSTFASSSTSHFDGVVSIFISSSLTSSFDGVFSDCGGVLSVRHRRLCGVSREWGLRADDGIS